MVRSGGPAMARMVLGSTDRYPDVLHGSHSARYGARRLVAPLLVLRDFFPRWRSRCLERDRRRVSVLSAQPSCTHGQGRTRVRSGAWRLVRVGGFAVSVC